MNHGLFPETVGIDADSRFVDIDVESRFDDADTDSRRGRVDGVTLHVVVAGPEDGEPVVLLHGFPECWYGWHEYVEPLTAAGYRVIVPDQRGYNASDKPSAVGAYHLDSLAGDVSGLLDAFDIGTAHLVGHDWGAYVAWWVGLHAPERVRTLSVLNVPHPTVFRRALTRNPRQMLRSWYVLFFQLPRLPETLARAGDWRTLTTLFERSSRPGTFDETDFERYRTAWEVEGAYRSMLNWYRAIVRADPRPATTRVRPPTLVLWGANDDFLLESLATESSGYCESGRLVVLDDATHWLHHEFPDRVLDELTTHFER
ncbi:alpha/beta fold hydrolase [Halobellus captivus]|uniref:alpha/beta fold hydrolase n=1 Tax=Halobellus captivus TaxID=2592614 RepID=UPI0011A58CCB|nr:alpha/beta hydrolase [Halobellus captivus]